jgi:hypothetical protein
MAPAEKRRKLSADPAPSHSEDDEASDASAATTSVVADDDLSDDSPDTEDEIAGAKRAKSKKTLKRKHRATDTATFGAALQTLLSTDAPSAFPLSLKPSISRKRNDEKLEKQAKKVLKDERKEKEDNRRVKDVIGGWGAESERALRKVAQRGGTFTVLRCLPLALIDLSTLLVVKLFNAIQQSQQAAAQATEETKAARGSGKPSLPAPTVVDPKAKGKKGKHKDNLIGRGKESEWCRNF